MLQRENPKQQKRENEYKTFVEVLIHNRLDGVLVPLKFNTPWDVKFCISKVLNVEPAASRKAGGQGVKYTCQVVIDAEDGRMYKMEIDLFHDGDFWFVEMDQLKALLSCA